VKYSAVTDFALSLPEVTEEPHFDYASFRIRGKIIATVPPDEKHLHVFVPEEDREIAVAVDSQGCEKLWWGKKVIGVRVTLSKAKTKHVEEMLEAAWARRAPKALVKARAKSG
jgi:hypothetical protein